jgi:chromosomal replication initiator protein
MNEKDKQSLQALLYSKMNRIDAERLFNQTCIKADNLTVSMGSIKDKVEYYFDLLQGELEGKGRCNAAAEARHVAFYLCYTFLNVSYPQIGKVFGNRDHTTVMHGVKKVEACKMLSLMASDIAAMLRKETGVTRLSRARRQEMLGMAGANYAA